MDPAHRIIVVTPLQEAASQEAVTLLEGIRRLTLSGLTSIDRRLARAKLQILAARTRRLVDEVAWSDPNREKLRCQISRLANFVRNLRLEYVVGLSWNMCRDWREIEEHACRWHAELERELFPSPVRSHLSQLARSRVVVARPMWRAANRAQRLMIVRDEMPPSRRRPTQSRKASRAPVETYVVSHLLALQRRKRVVLILGGATKPYKLQRMHAWFPGIAFEWIDFTEKEIPEGLKRRIKQRGAACVLMLEGLISHSSSDGIIKVCQQSHTEYREVLRGGMATMKAALLDIEATLGRK